MKPKDIQAKKRNIHLLEIKYMCGQFSCPSGHFSWPNQLRQTVNRVWGSSRRTAALQQHHSITQARSGTATLYNSKAHISAERDLRRLQFCSFWGRDRIRVNNKHTASAHTRTLGYHWPRREWGWMETMQTTLTRILTARLAQHRRGGDGNPYRNSIQHTSYSIQLDPRTFAFAAGMGMDGNHGNNTCTHQHLASRGTASIYSNISTLLF